MKKLALIVTVGALSLFGFNLNLNNQGVVEGRVIKGYTKAGFGKMGREWLFMDIKDKSGNIRHIAIAPTIKIPNLPIKEQDEVRVNGFTPPMFPQGVIKATDIYDVTQNRDYIVSGCKRGRGYWR